MTRVKARRSIRGAFSGVLVGLIALAFVDTGCTRRATYDMAYGEQPVRVAIVPLIRNLGNRYSVESLARRYGNQLGRYLEEVVMPWGDPNPSVQRRVDRQFGEITRQHAMQGTIPPNSLQNELVDVKADLIVIFDVFAYGQDWSYYKPITEGWPVKPFRDEPHLDKTTQVGLRARLYEAATGTAIGEVRGTGDLPDAIHGRSFDEAEEAALKQIVRETHGLIQDWLDAQKPESPGTQPSGMNSTP